MQIPTLQSCSRWGESHRTASAQYKFALLLLEYHPGSSDRNGIPFQASLHICGPTKIGEDENTTVSLLQITWDPSSPVSSKDDLLIFTFGLSYNLPRKGSITTIFEVIGGRGTRSDWLSTGTGVDWHTPGGVHERAVFCVSRSGHDQFSFAVNRDACMTWEDEISLYITGLNRITYGPA